MKPLTLTAFPKPIAIVRQISHRGAHVFRSIVIAIAPLLLVGFVRETLGLNALLIMARDEFSEQIAAALGFCRPSFAPLAMTVVIDCFAVAVTLLLLTIVCTRLSSFVGALVLSYIGLAQGRRLSGTLEIAITLSLPASLAFAIALSGPASLAALGIAGFSIAYIRIAIDPRRVRYAAVELLMLPGGCYGDYFTGDG